MNTVAPWCRMRAAARRAEVWLYGPIGRDPWTGEGVDAEPFARELAALDVDEIEVRIHSPGGYVDDGMAMFTALDRHPAKITAYVDGLAASMASVIAMAADEIVISPVAMMMIHQPWTVAVGDAAAMRTTAEKLVTVGGLMGIAYQRHMTGDADAIRAAMDATTWYTADEAVAAGLASRVSDAAMPIAALAGRAAAMLPGVPERARHLFAAEAPSRPAPITVRDFAAYLTKPQTHKDK